MWDVKKDKEAKYKYEKGTVNDQTILLLLNKYLIGSPPFLFYLKKYNRVNTLYKLIIFTLHNTHTYCNITNFKVTRSVFSKLSQRPRT